MIDHDSSILSGSRSELRPPRSRDATTIVPPGTTRPAKWLDRAGTGLARSVQPRNAEAEAAGPALVERIDVVTLAHAARQAAGSDAVLLSLDAHVTAEALRARSAISRMLIEAHGFSALALEAPEHVTRQLDRWVNGLPCEDCACLGAADPELALETLATAELFQWLQAHNAFLPQSSRVRVTPPGRANGHRRPTVIWGSGRDGALPVDPDMVLRRITIETTQAEEGCPLSPAGTFDNQTCRATFRGALAGSSLVSDEESAESGPGHIRLVIAGRSRPRPLETADPRHPIPRSFLFGL